MTHSEALVPALAAKYDIEYGDVLKIVVAVLEDLHRVAVQSEYGPMGAIYESHWLLDEEGQYHLTGIILEMLGKESPESVGLIVEDVFRCVSPERDLWNEELRRWMAGRHPDRVELDNYHGKSRGRAATGGAEPDEETSPLVPRSSSQGLP